ncbi:prespore-specific regulator [Mesobacillus persicus]|uniref:Prespore-specific regulator n=1 Tax=Mesobacillus persicus TaxID=930146 RepID=A0A1H8GQ75_9BACI|nr:RsfA family transcriptional regulator [Mesobacillus persicus]SEN45969.1 prespore-specific regulator [Mesobacillus persicus]
MKVRQDAWTEENDLLLAETVLRHVREGSTQLNAFEEVGDQLDRTSAACGFRWNAVVRHQYEKALQLAKKQRKQRQRILGKDQGGKKKLLYSPPVPSFDDLGIQQSTEMSSELTPEVEEPKVDSTESYSSLNTLEMQDAFGLDGLQDLQESLLLKESDRSSDSEEEDAVSETSELEQDLTMEEVEVPQKQTSQEEIVASMPQPVQQPMQPTRTTASGLTLGHVIAYLQNLNSTNFHADIFKSENERLMREIVTLRKENDALKGKVKRLEDNATTMQEDYETLMKIMNRARKLVLFDEEEDRPATKFKMDRNGNLEKVAE